MGKQEKILWQILKGTSDANVKFADLKGLTELGQSQTTEATLDL